MNLMSQVWKLSRQAGISDEILARRILGVSRATLHKWDEGSIPSDNIAKLEALRETLQYYIDKGKLPVTKEELLWQGIIHLTECFKNPQE